MHDDEGRCFDDEGGGVVAVDDGEDEDGRGRRGRAGGEGEGEGVRLPSPLRPGPRPRRQLPSEGRRPARSRSPTRRLFPRDCPGQLLPVAASAIFQSTAGT